MSYSISTLLTRNLHDVFGENDPARRRAAINGGSNGYRAAPVSSQLTPGLISSLPGTAGLPPFIFFLTNYPELDPLCEGR